LGYSALHKGFKCLDVGGGRAYISRDVVFDETVYPFAKLNPNTGTRLRSEILLLPSLSETLDTTSSEVQIIDSSTTDVHNIFVPTNASGPSAAPKNNLASFDVGNSLELALQGNNGGCGLGINHEGDSLARTVSGVGMDSHVDPSGSLFVADTVL
jgi:hypothetical protein